MAIWWLMLVGCTSPAEDSGDTDTPAERPYMEVCDAEMPLPVGNTGGEAAAPEPHAVTFGTERPDPYFVHLGFPDGDPSRSMAMVWRTDVDTLASQVQWGVGDALDNTTDGASVLYGADDDDPGTRVHEARLCGTLTPGTTYSYRVGGEGHWSETYQFSTPAAPGTFHDFRIGVLGDSRSGADVLSAAMAQLDAQSPDFIVYTGDMVEAGYKQEQWDEWFEATGDVLARIPLVPVHGNHEYLAVNYLAQFVMPGSEEWFTLRYGDLTLVGLNDTTTDDRVIEQADFLDEVLTGAGSDWTMLAHHRSMYATCARHGSATNVRATWGPAIEAHRMPLVVAGHNHVYERSKPVLGGQAVGADVGTTHIVAGGAGAPLYDEFVEEWFGEVATAVTHTMIIDVSQSQLDAEVRDLEGNVIDSFVIPRRAP